MKKIGKVSIYFILAIWALGSLIQFGIYEYNAGKVCRDERGVIMGTFYCDRSPEDFRIVIFAKSLVWPFSIFKMLEKEEY